MLCYDVNADLGIRGRCWRAMELGRGEGLSVVCLDMFGWELDMRFS